MTLAFEDFPPGPFGTFGPLHVTRDDIIEFASEFDPQPMHLNDEAAGRSMLRSLSGSGWHMSALTMRLLVDGFLGRSVTLGSPGIEEAKWISPLRPGDDLMLDVEVREARPLRSRPDIGLVTFACRLRNGDETRLTMVSPIMFKRRAAIEAGA